MAQKPNLAKEDLDKKTLKTDQKRPFKNERDSLKERTEKETSNDINAGNGRVLKAYMFNILLHTYV